MALAAPTVTITSQDDSRVLLTWTAVTGTHHYRIFKGTSANPTAVLREVPGTQLSLVDTGVPGTTYHYVVEALSLNDVGLPSADVSAQAGAGADLTALTGYQMKSPNGTRYSVTVNNAGALVVTALP